MYSLAATGLVPKQDVVEPAMQPIWPVVMGITMIVGAVGMLALAGSSRARSMSLGNARRRYGYDITTGAGQKRLMYESRGIDITQRPARDPWYQEGEWGHDPILDADGKPTGKVRMVPTGRVVDLTKVSR